MLNINNIYAGYNVNNPIIKGLNLTVNKGEVIGIIGRNGSGKSTLVKAICGQTPFVKGEILLDNKKICGLADYEISRLGVGFFQQGGNVFLNLTVIENLMIASNNLNMQEIIRNKINVLNFFEVFQKKEKLFLKASYLSGGERQQLALAMILLQKPKILILDEPSAGLAPLMQIHFFEILKILKSKESATMIIIEQNIDMLKRIADSIKQIQNGTFVY